jgi:hypothetical protein
MYEISDSVNVKTNRRQFRGRNETSRIVETIDRLGNRNCNRIYGKMKTTDHGTILRILERRALRFRSDLRQVQDQGRLGQQVDESGTLEIIGIEEKTADSRDREMRAEMLEREEL